MTKRIAHFLLGPHLWDSPPNDALRRIYKEAGYEVDFYSEFTEKVPDKAHIRPIRHGLKWLLKNGWQPKWKDYDAFSCTSEEPVVAAGVLSIVWRKPFIFLADEIRAGSYRGDRPEYWKKLCRWSMRQADLSIVNDVARIGLQREYAGCSTKQPFAVYPGCFYEVPDIDDRVASRKALGVSESQLVISFSGYCHPNNGIKTALEGLERLPEAVMSIQPLSMQGFSDYLLRQHKLHDRLRIEKRRLTWRESWSSMGAVDIGVAIYKNPAPQFQNMGISSNRLCMFLAMGVPVIVNRQSSFEFVEKYECGYMVENVDEYVEAVSRLADNLDQAKKNALRCAEEYIDTIGHYERLRAEVFNVLEIRAVS